MKKTVFLWLLCASPAWAQFGPKQILFRDSVATWNGPLDVHGTGSGTAAGPAGGTVQWTSDQHVTGTLDLPLWNSLTGAWEGTLDGTITVDETSVVTLGPCTITNHITANTTAAVDYLGRPLHFSLSLDIGQDAWSLWPSNNSVNGTVTSTTVCGGPPQTTTATQPMRFMPISTQDGFPFPATGFELAGTSHVACDGCGNANSNLVTYTFTYDLLPTLYPCDDTFSTPSGAFNSGASSGSVTLNTRPACTWTVTTLPAPWVTLTSPTSGTGSTTIEFTVARNDSGADRSTSIGVGGLGGPTFTIDQSAPGYFVVTPCRAVDTRGAQGPSLTGQTTREFAVGGTCGVPSTAMAVSANVTATQPSGAGYLTLFPSGVSRPAVSTVNYVAGETRGNDALLGIGPGGHVSVFCGNGPGTGTHAIIDVTGYFE